MNNLIVNYTGNWGDYSGYASANRAFITALYTVGIDVTTSMVKQVVEDTNLGWEFDLCKSLENRSVPYKIKIIHLTPDIYPNYMEPGIYHIGHLFWETTKLPEVWIKPINKMNEIWTSSEAMAKVFRASGVKIPIYWFPQPINIYDADRNFGKYEVQNHKGFMFYSVFQWIKRKNPEALIRAYWKAFQGINNVSLLLKTYRVNYSEPEFDRIIEEIKDLRLKQVQTHYPKILLVKRLMTRNNLMRLHATGECYVSADRGEGWNRVVHEAMLMGKPVISTARGGIHEYLNNDLYYRVPSSYVDVSPESWISWYQKEQQWAEVDSETLIKTMRYVFYNQDEAKQKGKKAKEFIKDNFSFIRIGQLMRERLLEINKRL